jgi:hypothetical protein
VIPLKSRVVSAPDGERYRVSVRWFEIKQLWRRHLRHRDWDGGDWIPVDEIASLPFYTPDFTASADPVQAVHVGSEWDGPSMAMEAASGDGGGFDLDFGDELGAFVVIVLAIILIVVLFPFLLTGIELVLVGVLALAAWVMGLTGLRCLRIEIEPEDHPGPRYLLRARGMISAERLMRRTARLIEHGDPSALGN